MKHVIGFKKGKRCEYCDKPRAQAELDANGLCACCLKLIELLRAEFDSDHKS
jgi:hypothetical protein